MRRASRKWRLARRTGPKGTYFSLRSGRGTDRQALSLGYVTDRQAEAACAQMNLEEARGQSDVVRTLHQENRDAAVRYLVGDPAIRDRFSVEPDYGAMALRDYFDAVFKEWRASENPGSWKQDEGRWRRINQSLGDVRLRQIDPHVVAAYLDGLTVLRGPRKGQQASGATRKLHRAAIQALLKRAHRLKHIDRVPDLGAFPIKGATKAAVDKPDPLDLDELHALMEASSPKFRAMWAVGVSQGLRPSELSRVHWEDIDLDRRTLVVRGTKTVDSAATVPMTPLAAKELDRWAEASGRPTQGITFPSRTGDVYQAQGWTDPLKEAAARAGITRRVYPQLLRDSFATCAWLLGIPLDVARQIMRHTASSRVLEEVYCRPRPQDVARMLEAFDLTDPRGESQT